jgi:hypothetical protein
MTNAAAQDAQWLKSLPEFFDFDNYFWNQPDNAKAWFGDDTIFDEMRIATALLVSKAG